MGAGIRRLREGLDDEAPLYYEGIALRRATRVSALAAGALMTVAGIWGMTRGSGFFEPAGTVLGALGVVVIILSWRFRLLEIVVGDRWLIVQCGPVRRRFGRHDLAIGPEGPASSWRRLYGTREVEVRGLSDTVGITVPVRDTEELRRAVGGGEAPAPADASS